MTRVRRGDVGTVSSTGPGPEAPDPDAERLISDVATLRALSDPLRLRILELMVTRVGEPWTAKELASRLDVPQTRLYHHIELLAERDLIRTAEQRVVSGIIESRYRVTATSFRLDRRLVSGDAALEDAGRELLRTVFDTARDDLAHALRGHLSTPDASDAADGEGSPDRPIVSRGLARLTPVRAAEFRTRLQALMQEFESDPEEADGQNWSLLVAFYPQAQGGEGVSHD